MKIQTLHLARRIIIAAVAAIGFWTIAIMLFENSFVYFPTKYPSGRYDEAASIPGLRDCWLNSEDGTRLHAWYAPCETSMITILMCHGNAGNVSHRLDAIRRLQESGISVFMFDYRGYGRSEGSPSEEGVYMDGVAAFDYVAEHSSDSSKIFLWGTSLGGAVAVDIATHRKAAGLILESTFSSAADVAATAYRFLPVRYILRTKFESESKIREIHIPILQIHGSRDNVIPLSLGKKLFAAANEPKQFYLVEGADHNDTYRAGGLEYLHRVGDFIDQAIKR